MPSRPSTEGSERRVQANLGRTDDIRALRRLLRTSGSRHLWYLTGHRRPSARFLTSLDRRYRLVARQDLLRTSVRLYEVPKSPRAGPGRRDSSPDRP